MNKGEQATNNETFALDHASCSELSTELILSLNDKAFLAKKKEEEKLKAKAQKGSIGGAGLKKSGKK
ncbi:hypothetical protein RND71_021702 [Anisodus tanguticus]|uniref:Uncharacterized protein n=1 Tax=Anisodus tanguticus TaxID=243964 RepID=A0AAE1RX04_9SOLA|nr:hypothetical protein RND71_021702 [Anisodus tanguticus]